MYYIWEKIIIMHCNEDGGYTISITEFKYEINLRV